MHRYMWTLDLYHERYNGERGEGKIVRGDTAIMTHDSGGNYKPIPDEQATLTLIIRIFHMQVCVWISVI